MVFQESWVCSAIPIGSNEHSLYSKYYSWFARPGKYWRKPREMQNSIMQHVTSKKGQVRCITYTEGAMELHISQCCHQRLVNDSIAFGRTYLIDSHLSTRYSSTSQLLHNWGLAFKMLPRGGGAGLNHLPKNSCNFPKFLGSSKKTKVM